MSDPNALAAELFAAWRDGTLRVPPPTARSLSPDPEAVFDMDAAYAVESAILHLHTQCGPRPAGVKVGYANKAMWRVLKLETLVWAHMYADTVHYSRAGATSLTLPYYRAPKIEPEIVFKLAHPIPPGADAATALASVEWLALGFEIIDSPFTDLQFQPADFVAAYGLHLALVVGEPLRVDPAAIPDLADALTKFKVLLSKNGELVEEGSGRNSLRSPALCLAELAAAMIRRSNATPLAADDLVSSGTLTSGSPVAPGEVWSAAVEGLPLAGLTLQLK